MNKFAFAAVGWLYSGALMQTLSDANLTLPSLDRAGVPGAELCSLDLPAVEITRDDSGGLAIFRRAHANAQ